MPVAAPDALLRPLRRLLRPLLRLLVRAGVTFPVLADELRALYVEAAQEAGARTDSRTTLLTGIHRKEIRRLREAPPAAPDAVPPVVTLNSAILARWLGRPDYRDATGAPLPLPRAAPEGPSFESLVASVTTDLRPRAVLDAWEAGGLLSRTPDGLLRLNEAAFIPRADEAARLHYFGRNLADHMAAACANLASPDAPPFLERALHYDRLTPEAAAALEAAGRAAAIAMLVELNRLALDLAGPGEPPPHATARVNLGVFLFRADDGA